MTVIEQLAQAQEEIKNLKAENDRLKGEIKTAVEPLNAKITEISGQLAEEKKAHDATKQALGDKAAKAESDLKASNEKVAKLESEAKTAGQRAAQIAAGQHTNAVEGSANSPSGSKTLLEQFNALTDPGERIAFARKHREELSKIK